MTYDKLDRVSEMHTSSGDSYTYRYTGDGQLHSIADDDGMEYRYNYDAIGRLVSSHQTGASADVRSEYTYDDSSRVKSLSYSIPGVVDSATQTWYYNDNSTDSIADGALVSMAMFSNAWLHYSYDSLSRLTSRQVGNILNENISYLAGAASGKTTGIPETFSVNDRSTSARLFSFKYTYDDVANITRVTDQLTGDYTSYAYDGQGQLRYTTDYSASGTAKQRYYYTYDKAGNLQTTLIMDGTATITRESHTYSYGDANWKDLLTAYDGVAISYDGQGNPLNWYNGQHYTAMTWKNGRELAGLTLGGKTYVYDYDVNGIRTRKTNADGGYTEYFIVDGLAVAEQRFNSSGSEIYTLQYYFDERNSPVGIGYQASGSTYWENYYFAKNLQGDVVAIYRSIPSNGIYYPSLVAKYTYDPWGKPVSITNASGAEITATSSIAIRNPFRYRGYYYDTETGFYYLQSRYYDPAVKRFLNADTYASTGQGFLGQNMFAYCNNNPVSFFDPSGRSLLAVIGTFLLTQGISMVIDALIAGLFEYFVTSSFEDALGKAGTSLAISLLDSLTPECLDVFFSIGGAFASFIEYKDWGMSNGEAFLMVALDIGVSVLPGRSADEVLGVLYEAMRRYGQITVETIKAVAETTLTSDTQNSNPNPVRTPRGGAFTYNTIGGGSAAPNKNTVAIFH